MLCQRCNSAEATVHLTNIENGATTIDEHLCQQCAASSASGGSVALQGVLSQMLGPIGVGKILSGEDEQPSSPACPHCGTTLHDIQKNGRLGCPKDYEIFGDALLNAIKLVQGGGLRHVGKIPRNAPPETKLPILNARVEHLTRRLSNAIHSEEYELAARLRDEIAAVREEITELTKS